MSLVNLQYFVDYKLAGNATDVVKYRNYFLSFLGFAAQIPNLILNGLNVFLHCKGSVILSLPVSRVDYPFFLPLLPVYPFLNTSTHFRDSDFQTNFRAFSPVSTGEIRDCGKFWRGVSKKSRLYDNDPSGKPFFANQYYRYYPPMLFLTIVLPGVFCYGASRVWP